jgi:hypothetical protein
MRTVFVVCAVVMCAVVIVSCARLAGADAGAEPPSATPAAVPEAAKVAASPGLAAYGEASKAPGYAAAAAHAPRFNDFDTPEMIVNKGTIQGGLPERPLTRNCYYGLAFKNNTNAQYEGPGADKAWGARVKYARVPGLDCFLSADVTVDGVEFDHVRKGGIMCPDQAARNHWKNVFYGPNCRGQGAELFSPLEKLSRGSAY